MPGPSIEIRDALATDEQEWRRLWAGYLAFYKVALDESVTARTWSVSWIRPSGCACA